MKFKESDLSPIFPPEVKPVHVGEYMTWPTNNKSCKFLNLNKCGQPESPFYFDGSRWRQCKNGPLASQNMYWRGLNRDPKLIEKERCE